MADITLQTRITEAVKVAATHADQVHKEGIFPEQAINALKEQKLLGVLCGECDLTQTAEICFKLGEACGATGLIFAMHQIEVAMLLNEEDDYSKTFLNEVNEKQLLLA